MMGIVPDGYATGEIPAVGEPESFIMDSKHVCHLHHLCLLTLSVNMPFAQVGDTISIFKHVCFTNTLEKTLRRCVEMLGNPWEFFFNSINPSEYDQIIFYTCVKMS
jgi:hypothetical protein